MTDLHKAAATLKEKIPEKEILIHAINADEMGLMARHISGFNEENYRKSLEVLHVYFMDEDNIAWARRMKRLIRMWSPDKKRVELDRKTIKGFDIPFKYN